MPRALSSRARDSSPATRSESSFEMTSAATFFPAKLTEPASIDLKVAVNLIAAEMVASATATSASVVNRVIFLISSLLHHVLGGEHSAPLRGGRWSGARSRQRLVVTANTPRQDQRDERERRVH